MKKIIECMEAVIKDAFTASGYDEKFARVNVSNRPIYASISATEPWQQPRHIRKHLS